MHPVDSCFSVNTPDQQVINESLEQLYGSPEDWIKGINQLLLLVGKAQSTEILVVIVQNHQLMSALTRIFGDDSNKPIELMFSLGKLFLSFSLMEDIHQVLTSHRVGALTLGLVELEVKRARHRILTASPALPAPKSTTMPASEDLNARRTHVFTKVQERFLFVCVSILDNLADDSTVLKKMIKKSLVDLLIQCLYQRSTRHLLVAVSLLKKASVFAETPSVLSRAGTGAISMLTHLLSIPQNELVHEAVITLFNLSFHQECIDLISADKIHPRLLALTSKHSLCNNTLKLLYHLSSSQEDRHMFYEAKITPCLVERMTRISANNELDSAFAGLFVNVSILSAKEF